MVKAEVNNGLRTLKEEYSYDYRGVRTSKTSDGIKTKYLTDMSDGLSRVLTATTKGEEVFYVRGFELISRSQGGDISYYLYDGGLSVRTLADEKGEISDRYTFDVFGNETEKTENTDNPYGFQGEERDATGLIYLRARYMDPATGTFTTMDTYSGRISDPASLHKYLFANSNPVMYCDPSGYSFSLVDFKLGYLCSAYIGAALSGIDYFINTVVLGKQEFNTGDLIETMYIGACFGMLSFLGFCLVGWMLGAAAAILATFYLGVGFGTKDICDGLVEISDGNVAEGIYHCCAGMAQIVGAAWMLRSATHGGPKGPGGDGGDGPEGPVGNGGGSGSGSGGSGSGSGGSGSGGGSPVGNGGGGSGSGGGVPVGNGGGSGSGGGAPIGGKVSSGTPVGSGAKDIIQYERLKSQYAAEEIFNADRVGAALKDDLIHRPASYLSKEQLAKGRTNSFRGNDNRMYELLQVEGQLNGVDGIYEYVINNAGQVTHQRFIQGGKYTGFPNQKVSKGGY